MGRPVIFLDIDGVIASNKNIYHPDRIEQLNRITQITGAAIVVISARRVSGLEAMRWQLKQWQVKGDVIDVTPNLSFWSEGGVKVAVSRHVEIMAWLEENACTRFVILDDEEVGAFETSLVRTDFATGLTKEAADLAIGKLLCFAQPTSPT